MNVKQIVIAHLKAIGADGLCMKNCDCAIDDLFPCGCYDSDQCVPAKLNDGCYRPIDTPNEPEETHL